MLLCVHLLVMVWFIWIRSWAVVPCQTMSELWWGSDDYARVTTCTGGGGVGRPLSCASSQHLSLFLWLFSRNSAVTILLTFLMKETSFVIIQQIWVRLSLQWFFSFFFFFLVLFRIDECLTLCMPNDSCMVFLTSYKYCFIQKWNFATSFNRVREAWTSNLWHYYM